MSSSETPVDAPAPHDLELLDRQVNRYQALVRRQASNSVRVKTWGLTLVAAITAFAVNGERPQLLFTALAAVFGFALLDSYYLSLERHFRDASDAVVDSHERGDLKRQQLFKIDRPTSTAINRWKALRSACKSWSIWLFYGVIAVLLAIGAVAGLLTG